MTKVLRCDVCDEQFDFGQYQPATDRRCCLGCADPAEGGLLVLMSMSERSRRGAPYDGRGNPLTIT